MQKFAHLNQDKLKIPQASLIHFIDMRQQENVQARGDINE
jgi:hypothetical protein